MGLWPRWTSPATRASSLPKRKTTGDLQMMGIVQTTTSSPTSIVLWILPPRLTVPAISAGTHGLYAKSSSAASISEPILLHVSNTHGVNHAPIPASLSTISRPSAIYIIHSTIPYRFPNPCAPAWTPLPLVHAESERWGSRSKAARVSSSVHWWPLHRQGHRTGEGLTPRSSGALCSWSRVFRDTVMGSAHAALQRSC
jgi:hypothetical protein